MNYQVCNIELRHRGVATGFLGLGTKLFLKYVAIAAGQIIMESKEYQYSPDLEDFDRSQLRYTGGNEFYWHFGAVAHQELLQRLMNEGWEVVATDETGRVTQMKKLMQAAQPTPSATQKPSNVELLQQLASLRDASILTEEEFQTKKAEILKRL